jgi:FKBP-type peptidyl-prolyl cis-trans isomerase SlyD
MNIENERVVSINYILKNSDGSIIDQSPEGEPLTYLHGAQGIIPGLESELAGKTVGEDFDVTIPPIDAYGEHRAEAVQEVPRTQFPPDLDIQPGMQFTMNGADQPSVATVKAVSPESVTLDANHPLAGLTLHFTGSIVEVREATEDERQAASEVG